MQLLPSMSLSSHRRPPSLLVHPRTLLASVRELQASTLRAEASEALLPQSEHPKRLKLL